MKTFFTLLISGCLFLTYSELSAQQINWKTESHAGIVYQISNKEAKKWLLSEKHDSTVFQMLHTKIDTFDVKEGWIDRPEKGHFILAHVVENTLHCKYTSVLPYQVFLLDEYNALALQVIDKDGNVRGDAKVKLGRRRLYLDKVSNIYRIDNQWFNKDRRIVSVELDGFTSFFMATKDEVPSWDYDDEDDEHPNFYSYMITDKNRYKPNDTIRFKSYALSRYNTPLRKELEIWLINYPKSIKIGNVSPHRPGSFTGKFHLHDSLNLTLDDNYQIQLRHPNGRIVAYCHFQYEDYELNGDKLEVKLSKTDHYFPEINQLTILAKDENGLMLQGARAEILVKTLDIRKSFLPISILPDTLFYQEVTLKADGETVFEIPSELFKKTTTSYQVSVVIRNTQNQRLEWSGNALFNYLNYDYSVRLSNDSICFDLLKNNVPMEGQTALIKHNEEQEYREVNLPHKEKINPVIQSYKLKNPLHTQDIFVGYINPELKLSGGIEKDFFNIQLSNPHNLEISWYIYQGENLIEKGFGKEIDFKHRIIDRNKTFYVDLLYQFGGEEHSRKFKYEFKEKHLNVDLDIPERIYPGQEVDATITVTDPRGKPVKNVDLTALAVTANLDYNLPDLDYYGKISKPRSRKATYDKDAIDIREAIVSLKYPEWKNLLGLDTMNYYRFIYPDSNFFRFSSPCADSTQFSIFAMEDGNALQVDVIEINHVPVYFSWTDQPTQYSFYAEPNVLMQISLRTRDWLFILDSVAFEDCKKTILSFDINNLPEKVYKREMSAKLTYTEENRYSQYYAYFSRRDEKYSYLETGNEFIPLLFNGSNATITVGPIRPGRKNYFNDLGLRTFYKHSGNFRYVFEENIVYKLNSNSRFDYLPSSHVFPMNLVNDRVLTKKHFLEAQKDKEEEIFWNPEYINIVNSNYRINIHLPSRYDNAPGIKALIFEDISSGNIKSGQEEYGQTNVELDDISLGKNNVIVVFNDSTYRKIDSVEIKNSTHIVLDMSSAKHHPKDTYLKELLEKEQASTTWLPPHYYKLEASLTSSYSEPGEVHGFILDEDTNDPLPGVCILVKGTSIGTITDVNGEFSLFLGDYSAILIISYVGYITEELEVIQDSELNITLKPDLIGMSEIVVVGYGYSTGSYFSPPPPPPAPDDEAEVPENDAIEETDVEQQLYQTLMSLNTIRSNFSDVGFWEPKLYTDKNGQAHFTTTFPDDITRWDAVVYAMNRSLQTGTGRKSIKSYKPIMAELFVPGFLTHGDSAVMLGKVSNYSADSSIRGQSQWQQGDFHEENDIELSGYHSDNIPVKVQSADSIKVRYTFTRDDGYFDGEERMISVVEQGIERADGTLSILKNGDEYSIKAGDKTVEVEILDNRLDIYMGDVRYLLNYKYACNEQLASKLIGLINYKYYSEAEQQPFKYDKDVKKIIDRLLKNQNNEFLWSWWDVSPNTSYWMSTHILRALKYARDAGYDVGLSLENLKSKVTYRFDFLNDISIQDADLINALASWKVEISYEKYINAIDSLIIRQEHMDDSLFTERGYRISYLKEKLLLLETRQLAGLAYDRNDLLQYRREGALGEVFFSDDKKNHYWYNGSLIKNTIAYRIVKNDSVLTPLITPMQMYFLSEKRSGYWNTYQSSNVLFSLLRDILADGYTIRNASDINLKGKVNGAINSFPYHMELLPGEEVTIEKRSGLPLYCQQYTHERVTKAKTGVEGFTISTRFDDDDQILESGTPVDLVVDVKVLKDKTLENIMLEIPVPGSCSYYDKSQPGYWGKESHREYFKEKTVIFCNKLSPGEHRFVVKLLPRFSGKYFLNPSQVSLMYVPVVNANTEMRKIVVE